MKRWPWLLALGLLAIPMVFPDLVSRLAPSLLYYPQRLSGAAADPAGWGLEGAEQVGVETDDGVRLHGWWIPARQAEARPRCGTVAFFHGNAGNIANRAPIARDLSGRGLDVLLIDYRGYGRSEGKPSEDGLYRDGAAAYAHLRDRRGVPPEELVLIGNSLGAAVALAVAESSPAAGVVITAGFRSLPSLARALYPWLPGRILEWNNNRFDNESRIARVAMPILVGWGGQDEIVPREHGRALYAAAREPKRWHESPRASHNDLWGDGEFWAALDRFLSDVRGCIR